MDIYKYSAIGRPLDFSYQSNKNAAIIALLFFVFGIVWKLIAGVLFGPSLIFGLGAAATAFLAWAIGREVDPDYNATAFLGAVFSFTGLLVFGMPLILGMLWLLFLMRIFNRTTGLPAKINDSIILFLLTTWMVYSSENALYAFAAGLVYFLDARFRPKHHFHLYFSILAIAGGIIVYLLNFANLGELNVRVPEQVPAVTISFFFLLHVFTTKEVLSTCDVNNSPLSPARVRWTQIITTLVVLVFALTVLKGFWLWFPVWSVMSAAILTRLFRIFSSR